MPTKEQLIRARILAATAEGKGAMSGLTALMQLLIEKGVMTDEDASSVVDVMTVEMERFTSDINPLEDRQEH